MALEWRVDEDGAIRCDGVESALNMEDVHHEVRLRAALVARASGDERLSERRVHGVVTDAEENRYEREYLQPARRGVIRDLIEYLKGQL